MGWACWGSAILRLKDSMYYEENVIAMEAMVVYILYKPTQGYLSFAPTPCLYFPSECAERLPNIQIR
jgi:hypothetical protein